MIVPHQQMASETLRKLITDCICGQFGMVEEMDKKIADACERLDSGEVVLVFEAESGACKLVPKIECRH